MSGEEDVGSPAEVEDDADDSPKKVQASAGKSKKKAPAGDARKPALASRQSSRARVRKNYAEVNEGADDKDGDNGADSDEPTPKV